MVPKKGIVTIATLVSRYWDEIKPKYIKNGELTHHYTKIKLGTSFLLKLYGSLPVNEFNSVELDSLRNTMIFSRRTPEHVKTKNTTPLSTETVNGYINIIKRMFKWGVRKGLVDNVTGYNISIVEELADGDEGSQKSKIVESAPRDDVFTTIAVSPKTLADMIAVQYWCAMRSQGVRLLRPCDIDMTHDIWTYNTHQHKTENSGKNPPIPIDPEASGLELKVN